MSDEKKYKHFNAGHVFGRIEGGVPKTKRSKEGKGSPFLRITVNCANAEHGNVLAYGKMFNKQKYESLIDHIKKHPASMYRFKAFFNQFDEKLKEDAPKDKKPRRFSGFMFWDWQPVTDEATKPRASFILVGEIAGIEKDKVILELHRENNDEEMFELHARQQNMLNGITEGDTVEVKGFMMQKGGENEYGEASSSPVLPYINEIAVRTGETF